MTIKSSSLCVEPSSKQWYELRKRKGGRGGQREEGGKGGTGGEEGREGGVDD